MENLVLSFHAVAPMFLIILTGFAGSVKSYAQI